MIVHISSVRCFKKAFHARISFLDITFDSIIGWIIINSGYIVDSFPSVLSEYFSPETINFMRILFCVTHFYSSAAWSLPAGFFILVSLTLHKLLTTYNQIIRNSVERILHESNVIGSIDPFNAEAFRFKHQQILKLLEVSNDMFGIFVLSIILSSMALLCFSTYMLLFMCATSFSKSLEASWAIISTIWLVLVSVTGSMINSEVRLFRLL